MDAPLVTMRIDGAPVRAGAHCSGGWDVDTPWHFHDMHQLVYAFEGAMEIEGTRCKVLVPRQFAAWIPAGTVHRTRIQRLRSGSVFLPPDQVESPAGAPRVVRVTALMREMILHAMRWPIGGACDPTRNVFFDCFARLCAAWIDEEVRLALPSSDDRRVAAAMDHMRRHIARISIAEASAAAAMSERSLRRHFMRAVGISWEDYRRRLRIHLAIDALDRSDLSIGTIAADHGYDSQSAFAAAFRALMNCSPRDYRRSKNAGGCGNEDF